MLRWIRNASPAPHGDLDVLVLIGHSKEHRDDEDFERFLAGVAADPNIKVVSMSDLAEQWVAALGTSHSEDARFKLTQYSRERDIPSTYFGSPTS